jgi:hypothetical protein
MLVYFEGAADAAETCDVLVTDVHSAVDACADEVLQLEECHNELCIAVSRTRARPKLVATRGPGETSRTLGRCP